MDNSSSFSFSTPNHHYPFSALNASQTWWKKKKTHKIGMSLWRWLHRKMKRCVTKWRVKSEWRGSRSPEADRVGPREMKSKARGQPKRVTGRTSKSFLWQPENWSSNNTSLLWGRALCSEASSPFGILARAACSCSAYCGHQLSRPIVFHLSVIRFFLFIKTATA